MNLTSEYMEWTKKWPTKEGWYWAHGLFYNDIPFRTRLISVDKIESGGLIYNYVSGDGPKFLFPSQDKKRHALVFAKCFRPEAPEDFHELAFGKEN